MIHKRKRQVSLFRKYLRDIWTVDLLDKDYKRAVLKTHNGRKNRKIGFNQKDVQRDKGKYGQSRNDVGKKMEVLTKR